MGGLDPRFAVEGATPVEQELARITGRWEEEASVSRRHGNASRAALIESMAAEVASVFKGGLAAPLARGRIAAPLPPALDAEEAAMALGVSRSWVYHQAKSLPFARKIGARLVFDQKGLTKWLEAQQLARAN